MTTDQLETLGAMVRAGIKPVIVTEEPKPKWSRLILPLLFVLCVVVAVSLNSAMYGGGR
jgi:hypothetical protein